MILENNNSQGKHKKTMTQSSDESEQRYAHGNIGLKKFKMKSLQ